ncbi:hypothetical protein UO65_3516 [Actinokineospora spheciospongiae]|uniref:Uncharacterized protein n=1 Tax=Actinokineospora spheciospongiae TaxID=909613 RepID=W7ILG5_9PSEU|nr:hypothetical protein UO65_3516 [Actinokineospora spheciospongiae]
MTGVQPLRPGEPRRQSKHSVFITGNNNRLRAVHRSDRHAPGQLDLRLGNRNRHHRAAPGQRLHQRRTSLDQLAGILQRPHPSDVRGSQLADGVTHERIRPHTPRLQQPHHRNLEREDRRLRETCVLNRQVRNRQVRRDLVPRLGEHRIRLIQLTTHAKPLRTLTREHQRRAAGARDAARGGAQGLDQLVARGARHDGAVVEPLPPQRQRRGHRHRVQLWVGSGLRQPLDLRPQRGGGAGGDHPRHHRHGGAGHRLVGGDALQDDVRVGAAHPERRHRRPARPVQLGPRPVVGQQLDRALRPVDVRARLVDVQGLGQHAVAQRQHGLDQPGRAGRGLGVPDVGLHRPQVQRLFPVLPVGGQQRLRLDRVTQGRAGAVRLHHIDVLSGQTGVGQRLSDHPLLRRPVRRGKPVRRAVLVHRRTPHHGQHPVPVAAGVRQPLQQHQSDTLAPGGAVGGLGERLDPPVGGQAALAAELQERRRGRHHRHTTGHRHAALTLPQRLRGQVQGDQGRGARRVDGDRRALQAQGVGHAAGHDGGLAAGHEVALGALGRAVRLGAVALGGGADEHAGRGAAQGRRVDARPLEDLPGRLQQHPLLRVHHQGLARGDAEEGRVERPGAVEERAFGGVGLAGAAGVRVEEVVAPAPVGGERADRVAAGEDQFPQVLGGGDPAGEAAGGGDDGDGLVGGDRGHGGGGGAVAEHHGQQVVGDRGRGRVVEDQGGGQPHAGGGAQAVAHVDGGQRVEAQFAEGPVGGDLGRVGDAEHGGGLAAHQVEHHSAPVGFRHTRQAFGQGGRGGARVGGGVGQRGTDLGQVLDQRPGTGGGEGGGEPGPVDVGDGDEGFVVLDGPQQGGHAQPGRHRAQAATLHVRLVVGVGHAAAAAPQAPRHGGGGAALGPAALGERVEVGVGGGVGALARTAPHARVGGEQHERVERGVPEQGVEVFGARGLARDDRGGLVQGGVGQGGDVADTRGVHDGGQRQVGGDVGEDGGQGVAVARVAGGDGDPGTEGGQLPGQFVGPGGGAAPAAGEHQVRGARLGQGAGDVAAEGAGAAGDEGGAARGPRGLRGAVAERGGGEAAHVGAGGAHGELVLVAHARQDGAETSGGAGVGGGRHVDQAAPAGGVLQAEDATEAPHLRLGGVGGRVGGDGGHGAGGDQPQRGGHVRVAEGLEQGERAREPGGDGRVVGVRAGVQGQGGDHPGEVGAQGGDRRGQGGAVGGGGVPRAHHGVADGVAHGGRPPLVGGALGHDYEPGTGGGGFGGGQWLPGHAVAPAVDGGAVAAASAPGGQGGQHGAERVGVDGQGGGQLVEVAAFDGGPEGGVGGVGGARGGGGVEPVPLPLEPVGGQVDQTSGGDGGAAVHRGAVGPRLPQAARHPIQTALIAAQAADNPGLAGGVLDHLGNRHRQHRVRTDLHHHSSTRQRRTQRRLELHRLPHVPVPVLSTHPSGVEQLTRHRGEKRNQRSSRTNRGHVRQQLLPQPIHLRRMPSRVHTRNPPSPDALGLELGHHQIQSGRITGNSTRSRAVHRRHSQHIGPLADPLPHLIRRGENRRHPTLARQGQPQLRPQSHHTRRIPQRQTPGDICGGDLTLRMTHHRSRNNTERLPHPRKRHHHREQHRLHNVNAFQRLTSAQDVRHRKVDELPERLLALHHRSGEHRRGIQQLPPHRNPLRTLTREHEDHALPRLGPVHLDSRVTGQRDRPVREHRTPRQGPGDVGRVLGNTAQGVELRAGGGLGLGRHQPRRRACRHRRGGDLGGLLDDDVGVGAGDAERRHPGPARPVHLRPRAGLGQQLDGALRPVDLGGGPVDVEGAGQHAVPHRPDDLDDARDTGGGLGVAQVGLDRPQVQRFGAVLAVGGEDGLRLDGVAQGGAGAVRLDQVDLGRGEPGGGQGVGDDPLLGRAVGGGEAAGRAVLVDRRAAHDGQDGVPGAQGVRQPLDQQHARALGEAGAVGGLGEGLAPAVGRQAALAADLDEGARGGHDGDAPGQGQVALALPQRLHGQVQGNQRRRAGGVHGDGGAAQAEGVGDAAGGDAVGAAVAQVALDVVGGLVHPGRVVLVHHAREHAGPAAAQVLDVDARALDGLPARLQQQPLVRVHRQRLAGRDAEEQGVEVGGVGQEAALAGVEGAVVVRVRVVEPLQVPAAIGGERADAVALVGDQPPQVLRGGHPAGVAAADADDGDRLVGALLLLPQALAGLVQIVGDPLEVVAELLLVLHLTQPLRGRGPLVRPRGTDHRTRGNRRYFRSANAMVDPWGLQPLGPPPMARAHTRTARPHRGRAVVLLFVRKRRDRCR